MEYVTNCEVCSYDFNADSIIPKVLDCGHSFCSNCIFKLIDSNPYCPKCRQSIQKKEFPTNFSLLGATEAYKSFKYLESHLVCSVQAMKNKLVAKREILTKKKTQIVTNLDLIKDGLSRLQELTESDEEVDCKKAKTLLEKLEDDYKKIENVILFNFWKLRVSVTINLNSFETTEGYLEEIYNRLQNDEKIYAVENIEDVVIYGKVSLQNNMILFHALSLTEKPANSTMVWFSELKQCISDDNFFTFLKLSCNEKGVIHMVTIKMKDTHLAPQFIKLCTGESGPTYKSCSYVKGEDEAYNGIVKLETYMLNNALKKGRIDYCLASESRVHNFITNDLPVLGENNGNFKIVRITTTQLTSGNVVGKVVSPTNLWELISYKDASKLKIVDCGIFFKF